MDIDYTEPQPTYYANTAIFSKRLPRKYPRKTGPILKLEFPWQIDFNVIAKEIIDVKELIYEITENIEICQEKINYLKQEINFMEEKVVDINDTKITIFNRKQQLKQKIEKLEKLKADINLSSELLKDEMFSLYNKKENRREYYLKYKQKYSYFKENFLDSTVTDKQVESIVSFLSSNGFKIKSFFEENTKILSLDNVKKEVIRILKLDYEDIIFNKTSETQKIKKI